MPTTPTDWDATAGVQAPDWDATAGAHVPDWDAQARVQVPDLIRALELLPHPEGGWYRETYRSPLMVDAGGAERSAATAIYFLLAGDHFSALHRIKSDEIWHFYAGSSLAVEGIHPDGSRQTWRVGPDLAAGDLPQAVVPAGAWFGAELIDKSAYALVGCTVSPGFDFADFELAERSALLARFPQHAELIARLTRTSGATPIAADAPSRATPIAADAAIGTR